MTSQSSFKVEYRNIDAGRSALGLPQVVVLLPLYPGDDPVWFKQCVQSLLDQDGLGEEFEVQFRVIVDGDVSRELLSSVEGLDVPVEMTGGRVNIGLETRLNEALSQGFEPGDLVARMDADDIAMPTRFRNQIRFLQDNPEISLVGAQAHQIDEFGTVGRPLRFPTGADSCLRVLHRLNPVLHPTFMFRSSLVTDHGLRYPPGALTGDLALLVWMAERGLRFANLETSELHWRQSGSFFARRQSFDRGLAELYWYAKAGRITGRTLSGVGWAISRLIFRLMPTATIARCYRSDLRQYVVRAGL